MPSTLSKGAVKRLKNAFGSDVEDLHERMGLTERLIKRDRLNSEGRKRLRREIRYRLMVIGMGSFAFTYTIILLTILGATLTVYRHNPNAVSMEWLYNAIKDKVSTSDALTSLGLTFGGSVSLNIALAAQSEAFMHRELEISIWRSAMGFGAIFLGVFATVTTTLFLICGGAYRSIPTVAILISLTFLTNYFAASCQAQITTSDRAQTVARAELKLKLLYQWLSYLKHRGIYEKTEADNTKLHQRILRRAGYLLAIISCPTIFTAVGVLVYYKSGHSGFRDHLILTLVSCLTIGSVSYLLLAFNWSAPSRTNSKFRFAYRKFTLGSYIAMLIMCTLLTATAAFSNSLYRVPNLLLVIPINLTVGAIGAATHWGRSRKTRDGDRKPIAVADWAAGPIWRLARYSAEEGIKIQQSAIVRAVNEELAEDSSRIYSKLS